MWSQDNVWINNFILIASQIPKWRNTVIPDYSKMCPMARALRGYAILKKALHQQGTRARVT